MQPSSANASKRNKKQILYDSILEVLEERFPAEDRLQEQVHAHLSRLPIKYAKEMFEGNCETVLLHKKLLDQARDRSRAAQGTNRATPVFHVRAVEVSAEECSISPADGEHSDSIKIPGGGLKMKSAAPSFGSSPSLVMLALGEGLSSPLDDSPVRPAAEQMSNGSADSHLSQYDMPPYSPLHEVTFTGPNCPSILSSLTTSLADLGLSILEAHAFTTSDGYLLDTFVVSGWKVGDLYTFQELLEDAVVTNLQRLEVVKFGPASRPGTCEPRIAFPELDARPATSPAGTTVYTDWEINPEQLRLGNKVAEGSFGDLYRGSYCGQTVAIKLLKPEKAGKAVDVEAEFSHEVSIMRKVRHKNVVQFIGVGSTPPNLYIVTEFMEGGCLYDHLKKSRGSDLGIAFIIRVALDVARGMDYLHKSSIIHRDLKAMNLLMDEHGTVKVSDFGVSRFFDPEIVMTAETGTYRWMAPEVIEHRPYDKKADVFSYGIFLWELVTGEVPYAGLTPLQARSSLPISRGLTLLPKMSYSI
ncbi:hypothetical protein CYMTET_34584 [Cymbomonas tetramitiformis]|uniref:non-specific serine/threonine protein kinase n=1 Tax=Cymbomonas tetramitiformis TaxID=36881 RepID=A0AAE0FAU9_9CHLO|nr:hypothetical protein CYMTET_34584 [Cymbomonas tetramitiformis]